VWELLWAGTKMGALKKAALVAEHFTRGEVRTPPSRGVGGAAVEAPSPDTVCELRRGIVRVAN
jgi:hypothetical protein